MLGTLLDQLTGYFSKFFLIGSFFPVLFAAAINGMLAYMQFPGFRLVIAQYPDQSAANEVYYTVSLLIALAVAAYLVSMLKQYLQEILEGEHWPSTTLVRSVLTDPLLQRQNARLRGCEDDLENVRRGRRQIRAAAPKLIAALAEARSAGKEKGGSPTYDPQTTQQLVELQHARDRGALIETAALSATVTSLGAALQTGDAANDLALDRAQQRLVAIILYANARWDEAYIAAFARRRALFGDAAVRPTGFGNIAATIRSYAASRYSMNLEAFWMRLQPILQQKELSFEDLQQSKARLDFMVTMFWLWAITVLFWLVLIAVSGHGLILFLGIAVAGPVVLVLWYGLALTNYVAFAQTVRSSIDLNRFDLLRALHMPLPAGLEEERAVWDALNQLTQHGESPPLVYEHGMGS